MTSEIFENKIIVNGRQYAIDKKLCIKFDKMVKRVTQENPKLDCLLINEGAEGLGKTNSSTVEALYFKLRTGRDVHLFFKIEPLMNFANQTEKKIIIWDEPSLDSLSTDQLTSLNKDMLRLFMTIRKRRHIFIVNYAKFWKFPEYMVVDRAIGLIHMYSSPKEHGKFSYIRRKRLETLWNDFHRNRKRNYHKLKSFRGRMPLLIEREFDNLGFYVNDIVNATYDDYENEKDKSIKEIGQKKTKTILTIEIQFKELKRRIGKIIPQNIKSKVELANALGINPATLSFWSKLGGDDHLSFAK